MSSTMPVPVCPQCGGQAEQVKDAHHFYNRVYECKRCKCIFGSPTLWYRCKLYGVLGKDKFRNDCRGCVNFPAYPDVFKCPWFDGKATLNEWYKKYGHLKGLDYETPKINIRKARENLHESEDNR